MAEKNSDDQKIKRKKGWARLFLIVFVAGLLAYGFWESRARKHALHYSISSIGAIDGVHFRMERAGYTIFHSDDAAKYETHMKSCAAALIQAKERLEKADSSSSGTAYIDKHVVDWFGICAERMTMWQDYIASGTAPGRKELLSRYDEKLEYIQQMQDYLARDHDFTLQRIDWARGEH